MHARAFLLVGVAKGYLFRTAPCRRPDRIGPLAYAHWVWLPIADLAYLDRSMIQLELHTQSWLFICSNKPASSKTLILMGFSPLGFSPSPPLQGEATIIPYY
jgi:hypothetical protein